VRPSRVGAAPEAAAALVEQCDEIAMPPSAVASAIGYAIERPDGVDVGEIVVRPTVQA
jgi:NADP-dependent 3-hydroxy acid dehydrogenase YdfG